MNKSFCENVAESDLWQLQEAKKISKVKKYQNKQVILAKVGRSFCKHSANVRHSCFV